MMVPDHAEILIKKVLGSCNRPANMLLAQARHMIQQVMQAVAALVADGQLSL